MHVREMLSRHSHPTAPASDALIACIETCYDCARTCMSCADECERHAGHHDHCRVCAEVCRTCERACHRAANDSGATGP